MTLTMDKESTCSLCNCHIKENTLFTGLTVAQLDAFKEAVVINHRKKREVVFMEGDECTGLYIIRTGRVKVVRSSSTGKEQIINIMNPGDLLGFEVFYNARTYKQTAVVMEDSDLCYIDRHAFFKILEREPAIARKLIISLGKELNNAYERIGHLGLL
ncbi:MAG TPA: cyclic nucleotide-binding domain-containing protein, partial [Thermodesulfobacteriota bacterium]